MIRRKDYKVPGGKLLRVEVEVELGLVARAAVRGDFFAHPEEDFEAAEAGLAGLPVAALREAARAAFARPGLTIYGASPEDIAAALEGAADEAQADRR
jgi:lipoate---protein ligase